MLSDATYNLMETASVISKGLHRYPQFQKDARDCQACQQVWNEMKQADEKQLEKLVNHLKEHLGREEAGTRAA
jgi:predicted metal-binding protein